jgi:hypothetical protein
MHMESSQIRYIQISIIKKRKVQLSGEENANVNYIQDISISLQNQIMWHTETLVELFFAKYRLASSISENNLIILPK